ncbi:hypothetical protein C3F34_11635 [Acinetobacter sp. ACNIH2]|jgi:autotransporter adhesin|uniref:YadA-like family protein n=1 Tax=Acinetobacter sp. ACNIH2 TaxID=1758189 RepID=UPI000CDCD11F|nr:YadA-like family protein [Acinetobacter sp. ACNIH2]AUX86625.1 hypothetical protein C3F34_11635 [Acinetobacter sp. ACNIH2]
MKFQLSAIAVAMIVNSIAYANTTVLGPNAEANGTSSVALGHLSHAQADNSTAVGPSSVAAAVSSTALGVNTNALGTNSTALGADSRTEVDAFRSTAIGSGSVATEAMTVSFGSVNDERRLVHVANGTADTDAVNVSQLEEAKAAATNNAQATANAALASAKSYTDTISAQTLVDAKTYTDDKSVKTLESANSYTNNVVAVERTAREVDVARLGQADLILQTNIDTEVATRAAADVVLQSNIDQERLDRIEGDRQALSAANSYTDKSFNKLEKGYQAAVAASIAIASLPQPTEAGKSMVSFGTGAWESEQGYAVGVSGVTQNNKWVYKAAGTSDSRGKFGGGLSFGLQW